MTGYGKAEAPLGDLMVAVEVRSVNHRFCEVAARVPKSLAGSEARFRKVIQRRVVRGRIDLVVAAGGEHQARTIEVDAELARQYYDALKSLQQQLGLSGEITVQMVAISRDVLTFVERETDSAALADHVETLITRAIDELDAMRRQEGEAIAQDLGYRVREIASRVEDAARRAPLIVEEYATRLRSRVRVLANGIDLDPARLAQEVALQAERSDYTEEVTRLRSHLTQCETMLKNGGAVGRALDFLFQEMNREINTIGSKANDAEVALAVVAMKSDLEKLREQVQNVE
ncbi:MAG: YicC family protein [Nitrospirae bacterium]|nr:YicC family protein [Nitrospirota bacterium]